MKDYYRKLTGRICSIIAGLVLWIGGVSAQVVTSNPAIPTESDKVTITFYADRGTGGLAGFTGDVYAHTGVIIEGSSEWKYAPTWGDNDEKYKLKRTATDVYTLEISPDIRQYYGVAEGEVIKQMAFVFRSSDKSKEGKDTGGKDIFVDVSDEVLSVSMESPLNNSIYNNGDDVEVKVNALMHDKLELFVNNTLVESTTNASITYQLTNVTLDEYSIKAVATSGDDTEEASRKIFVKGDVVNEPMPEGMRRGVNVVDASSATVVLFAPNKEYIYLVGDFNNWAPSNAAMMKKDNDYFWLTLTGLVNTQEYAYQFWIDGEVKVADPYANKILDPWNDKYIPERIYPNLKIYPEGQDEIVSVFTTAEQSFEWEVNEFVAPEPEQLVVYEVLIRDFTDNQDIKTVTDTLSYLKRLGVNAIELMPFNEFEGNDSWGYNPSFYFATDKAYGTVEDYKTFIDECHKEGIAVIMDMVLNHSYGQSPFARMYMGQNGKPLNNPWYNTDHNMGESAAQWGYDFNHESLETQALVDSICSYWMDEYKIDGFRFDFTKGFTNTYYPSGWASSYDADRIAILKRMADEIWKQKSDAIVMFEHLSENAEEKELANYGILLWGNANWNYNQCTKGFEKDSDLSWTSYKQRGWNEAHIVNYMESHDEERLMYRNLHEGNSNGDYDVTDHKIALRRSEAAAAFFIPIPGPKMIWQFGELGYDLSINRCTDGAISENCRLAQKPPKWEYMKNEDRMRLYSVYQLLNKMKTNEPVFGTSDFNLEVGGTLKRIELNMNGTDVRIIGNFGMIKASITPNFSTTGKWYNIFAKDSMQVTDTNMEVLLQPGEYVMYSQKKLSGFDTHTSVDEELAETQLVISPNPFSSEVNISFDGSTGQYELYNISGMKVKSGQLYQQQSTLNWGDLPSGHFILRIQVDNRVLVKKLVKR